jgi:hypothetical protein
LGYRSASGRNFISEDYLIKKQQIQRGTNQGGRESEAVWVDEEGGRKKRMDITINYLIIDSDIH